jgi:hypothetical protein
VWGGVGREKEDQRQQTKGGKEWKEVKGRGRLEGKAREGAKGRDGEPEPGSSSGGSRYNPKWWRGHINGKYLGE